MGLIAPLGGYGSMAGAVGGAGASGGIIGGLEGLLQNQMFLQYLSGAGGAMSAGQPVGPALNDITQGNIKAQNYTALLKKLLAGGGKMSMDKDNFSMKAPVAALSSKLETAQPSAPTAPSQVPSPVSTTKPIETDNDIMSFLNPSSSPLDNLSGADLAGLTPGEISQALQFKFAQDELGQKKVSDLSDALYKQVQMGKLVAETEKLHSGEADKPADIKTYEYAVKQGFKGSISDFKDSSKTGHEKDYERAVEGGYSGDFNTWLTDMARAGAINLGEIGKREEAKAGAESKSYFTSPKGLVKDVETHLNDNTQLGQWEMADNPSKVKASMAAGYVRQKIVSSGGNIEGVRVDGKNMVWTVKWPDGETSEVKYAF